VAWRGAGLHSATKGLAVLGLDLPCSRAFLAHDFAPTLHGPLPSRAPRHSTVGSECLRRCVEGGCWCWYCLVFVLLFVVFLLWALFVRNESAL
jgi:hypothetical protein